MKKPPFILMAITSLALILSILALIFSRKADAHWKPGTHNATHAIMLAWCGGLNVYCSSGLDALRVAKCESGRYWWMGHPTWAKNGQYRGMFQMGTSERHTWGHGPDPWAQARYAHHYYAATGFDWSPWECKP